MVDRIMEMEHNQRSEATSLASIVVPISTEVFFDEYFEAQPLLVARNDAAHFTGLLSLEHVDRIIATLDLRWPDISLINAARKIEPDEYIRQGDAVVAQVFSLHADVATIILNHLHTLHSPLADFCAALELEFSCPIQSNVYVTPPDAKGFKAHFDTHDLFILQVNGSKRWRLYATKTTPVRSLTSSGLITTNSGAIFWNKANASSSASFEVPLTICGMVPSSLIPLPCTTPSGRRRP